MIRSSKTHSVTSVSASLGEFSKRLMPWRLSAFLIASLMLGGTSQAILFPKLALNVIAISVIAYILATKTREKLRSLLRFPLIIGALFTALFAVYLIPFPASLWSGLSQSEIVLRGYELAQIKPSWRPLSLTPEDTALTLWNFLPPAAIIFIMALDLRSGELKRSFKALMWLGLTMIILGVLQFASISNALYIYKFSTLGLPTGTFSNTNHFGTFLVMLLPISVFQFFRYRKESQRNFNFGLSILLLAAAIPMIVLTDSAAGYLIMPVILILSIITLRKRERDLKPLWIFLATVLVFLLLDFFMHGKISGIALAQIAETGPASRRVIYETIWTQYDMKALFGTGPGSFYDVYLGFENRTTMRTKFVNLAHNDYLQVWLEMGLIGFSIMMSFVFYTAYTLIKLVLGDGTRIQIAAALSVVAVMIASLVDYPLRTIAICVLLSYFTVLMSGIDRDSAN